MAKPNHSWCIQYLTAGLTNTLLKCENYLLSTTMGVLCVCVCTILTKI